MLPFLKRKNGMTLFTLSNEVAIDRKNGKIEPFKNQGIGDDRN